MSNAVSTSTNIITKQLMHEAVKRSGYLIEQRVVTILESRDYFVQTNPIYPDPETGKSREIDLDAIDAISIYRQGDHILFPNIICECKNNLQPVVFFIRESQIPFLHCMEVKFSGFPTQIWNKKEYIDLTEFLVLGDFHHYCTDWISTQYCTFQFKKSKDKNDWMAIHSDEQHISFNSLINYLEYQIEEQYSLWDELDEFDKEEVCIQLYYPLLILQGDLYSAYLKNNRLYMKKSDHLQFRKQLYNKEEDIVETYQIDIITEDYLERYLDIVDDEIDKIKKILQRKRQKVFDSMEKIVADIKGLKPKPESYLDALERILE